MVQAEAKWQGMNAEISCLLIVIFGITKTRILKRRFGLPGGHYNYWYRQVEMLADEMKRDFLRDGKYTG